MNSQDNLANSVHLMLQGKGGCSKSTSAALFCMRMLEQKKDVFVFDTDTENKTISQYKSFNSTEVNILDGDDISPAKFDGLMDVLLSGEEGIYKVDNGANSFRPLLAYVINNSVVSMLESAGRKVYIHTVLSARDLPDTVGGAMTVSTLCENTGAKLVIWVNEKDGPAQMSGIDVLETRAIQNLMPIVAGVVRVEENKQYFAEDFKTFLQSRLTAQEVLMSTDPAILDKFGIMNRQRIKIMTSKIFKQIDAINW